MLDDMVLRLMDKAEKDNAVKLAARNKATSEKYESLAEEARKQKAALDAAVRKSKENSGTCYHPKMGD